MCNIQLLSHWLICDTFKILNIDKRSQQLHNIIYSKACSEVETFLLDTISLIKRPSRKHGENYTERKKNITFFTHNEGGRKGGKKGGRAEGRKGGKKKR